MRKPTTHPRSFHHVGTLAFRLMSRTKVRFSTLSQHLRAVGEKHGQTQEVH